jgi:hypothetical protein
MPEAVEMPAPTRKATEEASPLRMASTMRSRGSMEEEEEEEEEDHEEEEVKEVVVEAACSSIAAS